MIQHQRDVQKNSGKNKAVWTRQSGRCYYCNQPMLPDQEVEVIEKNIGQGRKVQNLIYIHRRCSYDIFDSSDQLDEDHVDLFSMLEGIMDTAPSDESPYLELTDFFRESKQNTISLHFREIESILGDVLPWEAYCYDAFWYDDTPEQNSPMWISEEFPFQTFLFSAPGYNIADCWTTQGYQIKTLRRESCRVVFRKTEKTVSGYALPKSLAGQKLPNEIIYKLDKVIYQFMRENGL